MTTSLLSEANADCRCPGFRADAGAGGEDELLERLLLGLRQHGPEGAHRHGQLLQALRSQVSRGSQGEGGQKNVFI